MMDNVVEFPKTEYLLRCRECTGEAFFVFLGSSDPYHITELECATVSCGKVFSPTDSEISYPASGGVDGR